MTDGFGQYAPVCTTIVKPSIPVAAADYYVGRYNTPRAINASESILANDVASQPGATLRVTNITVGLPASAGNITLLDNTAGTFVFTPVRGFTGNASFQYGAWVGGGG